MMKTLMHALIIVDRCCIDEKFFEVHDELCIHAIVNRFVDEDS